MKKMKCISKVSVSKLVIRTYLLNTILILSRKYNLINKLIKHKPENVILKISFVRKLNVKAKINLEIHSIMNGY